MQTYQIGCGALIAKFRQMRSPLRAQICRHLAAGLCVVLIIFAALAATTAGRQTPISSADDSGGNLMLVPGWPGLAPVLY